MYIYYCSNGQKYYVNEELCVSTNTKNAYNFPPAIAGALVTYWKMNNRMEYIITETLTQYIPKPGEIFWCEEGGREEKYVCIDKSCLCKNIVFGKELLTTDNKEFLFFGYSCSKTKYPKLLAFLKEDVCHGDNQS